LKELTVRTNEEVRLINVNSSLATREEKQYYELFSKVFA